MTLAPSAAPATIEAPAAAMRPMQLELSRPLPELAAVDPESGRRYGAARLLVRLCDYPLGLVELPLAPERLSPARYSRTLWEQLEAPINAFLAQNQLPPIAGLPVEGISLPGEPPWLAERARVLRDGPLVSVVVCTRDRLDQLRPCLATLTALDYPRYELIVVDNAPPTDATARYVQTTYGHLPWVRYVLEPRPGLARARNTGLAEARGALVAFTDDDVVADEHWLTELARVFLQEPAVACVTGLTLAAELETEAQLLFERFGGFNKGRGFARELFDLGAHRPAEPLFPYLSSRLGAGVNMAFRTDALRAIGGFDPALGTGTPAMGSEDIDAFLRVILAGHTLAVEPAAILHHYHRREYGALRRQLYGSGVGFTAYLTRTLIADPLHLLRLVVRLPAAVRYLTSPTSPRNSGKGAGYPRDLSRTELQGMLYGPIAYLRSRLRRGGEGI